MFYIKCVFISLYCQNLIRGAKVAILLRTLLFFIKKFLVLQKSASFHPILAQKHRKKQVIITQKTNHQNIPADGNLEFP